MSSPHSSFSLRVPLSSRTMMSSLCSSTGIRPGRLNLAMSPRASSQSSSILSNFPLLLRSFIETGYEIGNNYSDVIAPHPKMSVCMVDCARLPLLIALSLSRYASCLGYLEKLKANLLLDIHLHDHVETLYTEIRHKAIIQYTLPFISVDLHNMADAFKTTVAGLEKELEALITNGQIQARIDSHNKILYARHADQRKATFQRVLQTGGEFEREVRSMLLRANLVKHEVSGKSRRKF